MTTLILPRQLATTGLVEMMRAVSGGKKIFDARVFGTVTFPFAKVIPMGGPAPDGPPLMGDGADVCLRYQVDCVGQRRDQAEAMADLVRGWIVSSDGAGGWTNAITVAGWRCSSRRTAQFYDTHAEGQPGKELFVCRADYELDWTPA